MTKKKILIDKFVTSEYIHDEYKQYFLTYEKYRDNYYDFYQCFQY